MAVPAPQPYRCSTCQTPSANSRNLAIFIDGTSNEPGPEDTNIWKLHSVLSDRDRSGLEQLKDYYEGIGVHNVDRLCWLGRAWDWIYSNLEMASAWSVQKNVTQAYSWLAEKYQEGDRIYLFGFSRGAYQVRALAGMIHEVGLVKNPRHDRIQRAYRLYISLDPNKPKTKAEAIGFKKKFCSEHVRIHFVGVWDTVSSLGLSKKDVRVTASATVTNACHFRHALALDERRVKFIPEYFSEANAHHSIRSPRANVGDVREVWFAGYHSDVGGTSRPPIERILNPDDDERITPHAGRASLSWMSQEAASHGLIFSSEELSWCPEDINLGRKDSMSLFWWKFLEFLPIRHQVSFSGTGKHKWRPHLSRPRVVTPKQRIHSSVLSSDTYVPCATLGDRVDIPTATREVSNGLWTADVPDEGVTTRLLTSLLNDRSKALESLSRVLFLFNSRLENGHIQAIHTPQWLELFIDEQPGFDSLALTVIYDVISDSSTPERLVTGARDSLRSILPFLDKPAFPRALYILRFLARHKTLRRRFISRTVIDALMLALDRIANSRNDELFPWVIDCLCYLVDDNAQRNYVVGQLAARSDGTETGKTRLSLALDVKAPNHLTGSLKMIASLAQHERARDHCYPLKPKIIELAKEGRGPVGLAAVEALVALNVPPPHDIHFSSILAYLGNTLPRLDVEIGSSMSPNDNNLDGLPLVLQVDSHGELAVEVVHKLCRTIELRDAHERTMATLTLLKLCRYPIIRDFCSRNKVLDIFIKQLEQNETSLLAAYALKMCLKLDTWAFDDFHRVAKLIVRMVDKNWFDNVVGRVEGSDIFRELMASHHLRQQVISLGIVATLCRKLQIGDPHETRMSLICLEILGRRNPVDLESIVIHSLTLLKNKDIKIQRRGVKVLASLAQTEDGERAIQPHVIEIVKMLLPPPYGSSLSRSQLFGPTTALYDLSKNETLREQIKQSEEFAAFRGLRHMNTLYPRSRSLGQ